MRFKLKKKTIAKDISTLAAPSCCPQNVLKNVVIQKREVLACGRKKQFIRKHQTFEKNKTPGSKNGKTVAKVNLIGSWVEHQ